MRYSVLNCGSMEIERVIGFGEEPVKEKILYGNSFKIIIRDMGKEVVNVLHQFCLRNRFITFVNYYDNQRFGMAGGPYNTHLIGKAVINGNWKFAFSEFKKTENLSSKDKTVLKQRVGKNRHKDFFKSINPQKLSFFVASHNSFLWNKEASLALEALNEGEKYKFPNIGNLFLPSGITFKSFNVHSINGFSFSEDSTRVISKLFTRSLTVTTAVFLNNIREDDLHNGKWKAIASFFLPSGSYATMLIKQMFVKSFNVYDKKYRS